MDLLQTAEYAIPGGSEEDWRNPTQTSLWQQATLIGKYQLGDNKAPINAVVSLVGQPGSYWVQECKLVSNEDYKVYQDRYDSWKKALYDFYQFFDNAGDR